MRASLVSFLVSGLLVVGSIVQANTQTVAEAEALPKLGEMVAFLWRNCPAPTGKPPQAAVAGAPVFDVKPGDFALIPDPSPVIFIT